MPGYAVHDFGDLVRSVIGAGEERDQEGTGRDVLPVFTALAGGFLAGFGPALTATERALLAPAGRLLAFELGLRFLTDHLEGDRYFAVDRPEANRERARRQFRLAAALAAIEEQLHTIVEREAHATH
jgi:hypothetical protein